MLLIMRYERFDITSSCDLSNSEVPCFSHDRMNNDAYSGVTRNKKKTVGFRDGDGTAEVMYDNKRPSEGMVSITY